MSDQEFDKKLQKAIDSAIDRWADKRLNQIGKWSIGIIAVAALTVLLHLFVKLEGLAK